MYKARVFQPFPQQSFCFHTLALSYFAKIRFSIGSYKTIDVVGVPNSIKPFTNCSRCVGSFKQ